MERKPLCYCKEKYENTKYEATGDGYFSCNGCGNAIYIDKSYEKAYLKSQKQFIIGNSTYICKKTNELKEE